MSPNWRALWVDQFVRIRDQLYQERAAGMRPRLGMKNYSDGEVDRYSREEASRRAEVAILRHNAGEGDPEQISRYDAGRQAEMASTAA